MRGGLPARITSPAKASEGWCELKGRYDDGGFSDGSLDHPAMTLLLAHVEAGAINVAVVYKIDRLSRSLRDFARLLEAFESRGVTFVSVTQQFSTTSSMGRLTFNVLLSFAQFEREITSERTRDKFSALRERGVWTTGPRPSGYQLAERRLVVDAIEAAVIRRVYALHARLRSAMSIDGLLNAGGLLTHLGLSFYQSFVRRILENPLYRGELTYLGSPYPGAHRRIISERVWARTEAIKDASAARRGQRRAPLVGLLTGLLYSRGQRLLHVGSRAKGKLYRYYERAGRPRATEGERVERFRALELKLGVLALLGPEGRLWSGAMSRAAAQDFVRSPVDRIDVGPDMVVLLKTGDRSAPLPWVGPTRSISADAGETAGSGPRSRPSPIRASPRSRNRLLPWRPW